ncbi:ferredoxin/flavodoxin---NADP+ reductase, partial [Phenoliferia sp. Uapishka_3]
MIFLRRRPPSFSLPFPLCRNFSCSPHRSSSSTTSLSSLPLHIGIIGAGPSGFYAATRLLSLPGSENTRVDLFEALPVPFGLARFGVAPDHPEVKNCEHKFEETARDPRFRFFGNVELASATTSASKSAPSLSAYSLKISLDRLKPHYDALLLTYGASNSRPLSIPGEDELSHVLPARDFVAWYNAHPSPSHPASSSNSLPQNIDLSKLTTVTLIGQGNVALDIARLLLSPLSSLSSTDLPESVLAELSRSTVKRVKIVGRRGPLQLAATTKEVREMMALPNVGFSIDQQLLAGSLRDYEANKEMRGGRGKKRALEVLKKGSLSKAGSTDKEWSFEFLKSPLELLSRDSDPGRLGRVKWGFNELLMPEGGGDPADCIARATGRTEVEETDLVLSSVGYRSVEIPGIPFDKRRGVVRNEGGRVLSEDGAPIKGLYASGWLARGPNGVIATTMYDAFATADLLASDLASPTSVPAMKDDFSIEALRGDSKVVTWQDWENIDREERRRGEEKGKVREKMQSVEEMLSWVK